MGRGVRGENKLTNSGTRGQRRASKNPNLDKLDNSGAQALMASRDDNLYQINGSVSHATYDEYRQQILTESQEGANIEDLLADKRASLISNSIEFEKALSTVKDWNVRKDIETKFKAVKYGDSDLVTKDPQILAELSLQADASNLIDWARTNVGPTNNYETKIALEEFNKLTPENQIKAVPKIALHSKNSWAEVMNKAKEIIDKK